MSLPNPGSDDAIAQGCKCPVTDNCRGLGIPTSYGPCFYYSDACPMHSNPSPQEPPHDR